MAEYVIKYSKQSIRALKKMPKTLSGRILKRIDSLAKDPYGAHQVKCLKGLNAYRLRVGDWRVVYKVLDNELEIWIIKVAPRGEVYKS